MDTYILNLTINATSTGGARLCSKAFLSGPYDASTGLMNDSLRVNGLIPGTEPYSTAPFNKPVVVCANGETVSSTILSVTGNDAIVDWILLELRSASNAANVIATKRALLQRDGDIVSNVDGSSPVEFDGVGAGNYFVSVKHRNHLGVMTALPISLSNNNVVCINFSTDAVYTMPSSTNAARKTVGTVKVLWSGDANNNKNVKYNGFSNDKEAVLNAIGGPAYANTTLSNVYRMEDVNMDGKIRYNNTDNDRIVIINNIGVSTPNNIIFQHTPN